MTTRRTIAAAALFALHQRRGSDLVDAPTTTMSPVFGLLNRLILLSLRDPCSRNKSISTRIACANVTGARHAKQYRVNSSNLDDLSARNWIAERPNGVL
jgi:hypothetical protein